MTPPNTNPHPHQVGHDPGYAEPRGDYFTSTYRAILTPTPSLTLALTLTLTLTLALTLTLPLTLARSTYRAIFERDIELMVGPTP